MPETPQEPTTHPPELPDSAGAALSEAELAQQRAAEFARVLRELTPRVFVTPVLVAINIVVFVAAVLSGVHFMNPSIADLLNWGADFGPKVLVGEWWRTFTCTFLHIGVIHIAMNMFILAAVGPLVERLVGNTGFLILYVVSGLFGSMVSLCYHPLVVSAGASGAVFGVYGALIAVLRQKPGAVPAETLDRIRKSGLAFVGYNLLFGFMLPGIDNAAHIGGLIGGFLCGVVLNLPLAPESRAKRPARNVAAAVCGLMLVGLGAGGFLVLHSDLGDADAATELERFAGTEDRLMNVSDTARARAERGELSWPDFADIIQRDVLPEWRATAERLGKLQNVPPDVRERLPALLNYMKLRQQGWELQVQAVRENDPIKMRRADEAHSRADEIAHKLNPSGKPGK
jgi:rhomboid protease GluP